MNIVYPSKNSGFVIPAKAGKRAIPGEFRGTAIQLNKIAEFRVKPGMTISQWFCSSLILFLLSALLWLPCFAIAAQQTILVFGDSLSAAYGIPRDAGWVNLLQKELQRSHPQYKVVNTSISGETTTGGRQRIAAALHQHKPSIIILELGANDGLRGAPINNIEANLSEFIRQSRKAGAKVLLLGMQLPPNYGKIYTDAFKTLYAKLAQRYHVALVPFLLEGVKPEQFQADNLHPVAQAQPHILQNVMQKLKPLLD